MYVKYLINRIKNTPSNMWKDWISFRNYPGMEYRDVHNIMPKSHLYKFLGNASHKFENEGFNSDYFKWDFKLSYRYSIYFVRRLYTELPTKYEIYHSLPITDQDIKELSDRHPNWKEYYETAKVVNNSNDHLSLEEKHQEYANLFCSINETKNYHYLLNNDDCQGKNLYQVYFPVFDNFGSDKNVDASDMDSKYLYTYFDNLQVLYDNDKNLKEFNDYKRDVYVGRTKAWQVLPDFYGKDQVDKIQAAIGAPLQDQLDEWETENINKKIQMPINNQTLHQFRDVPDHFENLDHDYERIIYERNKNQKYEQLRNTRYDELLQLYQKNNLSEH